MTAWSASIVGVRAFLTVDCRFGDGCLLAGSL